MEFPLWKMLRCLKKVMVKVNQEDLDADVAYEAGKDKFLKDNNLSLTGWDWMLISYPGSHGEVGFCIDLERIGYKQYVDADKTNQLVQWMKLTEELFGV